MKKKKYTTRLTLTDGTVRTGTTMELDEDGYEYNVSMLLDAMGHNAVFMKTRAGSTVLAPIGAVVSLEIVEAD